MVKHGLDIIKLVTQYLNPGQLPVLTFDGPLFALAKYIQWSRPTEYGEDNFLVMIRGLHIEMNSWKAFVDYLMDQDGQHFYQKPKLQPKALLILVWFLVT